MRNGITKFLRSSEALALLAGAVVLLVPLLRPGRPQWIASGIAAGSSAILAYGLYRIRTRAESQGALDTRDARRHRNFQLRDSHEVHGKLDEMLRVQANTYLRLTADTDDEFKRRSLPIRLTLLGLNLHSFATDFWQGGPRVPVIFGGGLPGWEKHKSPSDEDWDKHRRDTLRIFQEEFAPDIRSLAEELKATDASDVHQRRIDDLLRFTDVAATEPDLMIPIVLMIAVFSDSFPKSDLPGSDGLVQHL